MLTRIFFFLIAVITLMFFLNLKDEKNSISTNLLNIDNYETINIEEDAYLEIPKINLKKPIYELDDYRNNIDYGIEILSESNSNILYLAAHSGNSELSIFNRLIELVLGSNIILNYNGVKMEYNLKRREIHPKTGELKLNISSVSVVLITCFEKEEQLVLFY